MDIANSIKDKGFYYIPDFISEFKVNALLNSIKKLNSEIGKDKATVFYEGKKLLLKDLINFKLKKLLKSSQIIFSKENNFFSEISSNIFRDHYLKRIDYYSSSISAEPIINWHNDISYSGAEKVVKKFHHPNFYKLRFFLYLTDVEYKNGSLAILPSSQKVSSAVASLLYDKKIEYKPHWSLQQFCKYIDSSDVKDKLINIIGTQQYNDFISNTGFIFNKNDTDQYDVQSKKGGLVIFDDRCFHRGSNCSKSERSVLRYIYSSNSIN